MKMSKGQIRINSMHDNLVVGRQSGKSFTTSQRGKVKMVKVRIK
jgi:hypothetical protein